MTRTLREVIDSLPLDERQDVEARAARLISEETRVRDLAQQLHSYFRARGGKLRLTVEFPNGRPMELTNLVEVDTDTKSTRPKSRVWRFRSIDRARKSQSLRDASPGASRNERARVKRPG